jgi:very-short-patch-repair endonuclease
MSRNPFKPTREMLELARRLRREQTPAEKALWEALRGRGLCGHKFRRQHPFGCFVVDFYCAAIGLVVEVDGAVHDDLSQRASDDGRALWLRGLGLEIVRVTNDVVLSDLGAALRMIADAAARRPAQQDQRPPSPTEKTLRHR